MNSLLATTGSLATNWRSGERARDRLRIGERTLRHAVARPSNASLTSAGSSFAPSGISFAATTTSTVCAIARWTSDSRFLIAEKTTIAASTAPIPARITNTIGRFIYAPSICATRPPAPTRNPPSAAQDSTGHRSLTLPRPPTRICAAGHRSPPPHPRHHWISSGLRELCHAPDRVAVTLAMIVLIPPSRPWYAM